MTVKQVKYSAGLTLVETAIATVILLIAILGACAFRYNAALCARKADKQAVAARTALLLCEGWRAASDANSFDPTELGKGLPSELSIEVSGNGPDVPPGFTALGSYTIVADKAKYYASLSWKYGSESPSLRILNVDVAWQQRSSALSGFRGTDKLFKLVTCAEN